MDVRSERHRGCRGCGRKRWRKDDDDTGTLCFLSFFLSFSVFVLTPFSVLCFFFFAPLTLFYALLFLRLENRRRLCVGGSSRALAPSPLKSAPLHPCGALLAASFSPYALLRVTWLFYLGRRFRTSRSQFPATTLNSADGSFTYVAGGLVCADSFLPYFCCLFCLLSFACSCVWSLMTPLRPTCDVG